MMQRVLPLVLVCVVLVSASNVRAGVVFPARGVSFGVGVSAGLEAGATAVSGLGVEVSVTQSLRQKLSYGLSLDHLENGLQLEPSRRAEYNTTGLAGLLGWQVGGERFAAYVRSGVGVSYIHERVRQTLPHGSWVLADGSNWGPSGQVGAGVSFSLDEKAQGYVDVGVSQVWGERSHTSGSLLAGVVTRW